MDGDDHLLAAGGRVCVNYSYDCLVPIHWSRMVFASADLFDCRSSHHDLLHNLCAWVSKMAVHFLPLWRVKGKSPICCIIQWIAWEQARAHQKLEVWPRIARKIEAATWRESFRLEEHNGRVVANHGAARNHLRPIVHHKRRDYDHLLDSFKLFFLLAFIHEQVLRGIDLR